MKNDLIVLLRREEINQTLGLIGHLGVYDQSGECIFNCATCENVKVGSEANKDLAIPYGFYSLDWHRSAKFTNSQTQNKMARIWNEHVSKNRHILIHAGNSHKDTAGCILLGVYKPSQNTFSDSRKTVEEFYALLKSHEESWNNDKIQVVIVNHTLYAK